MEGDVCRFEILKGLESVAVSFRVKLNRASDSMHVRAPQARSKHQEMLGVVVRRTILMINASLQERHLATTPSVHRRFALSREGS